MRWIIVLLTVVYSRNCSAEYTKDLINEVASISVSDHMDISKKEDAYTKRINDVLEYFTDDKIVFQQKGLSDFDKTTDTHYANDITYSKEIELETGIKSVDRNRIVPALLVGVYIMVVCVLIICWLYKTKRLEHPISEQKGNVERSKRTEMPSVVNNEQGNTENTGKKRRTNRGKKDIIESGIKKSQPAQDIKIEYPEPKPKDMNDGYIPEQKIIYTNYCVPNVQRKDGYYCFILFPKKGTIVFPYREQRIERRGFTETDFEKKLRDGLADYKNYKVLGDVCILPVDNTHPYEPDIAIIEINNNLGIRIDIEIDEPYTGYERKAIHCIRCGDEFRNLKMCMLGWIVIRFSEKQVYTEAEKCIGYIKHMLSLIDKTLPNSSFVSPQADKQWTYKEAVIMAAKDYRESYLHHQFNLSGDFDKSKSRRFAQTEIEKEAIKLVQPIVFPEKENINIDKSLTKYYLDNRIGLEPREHVYILDGVRQLDAVSNVVARFFRPFDTLKQSRRYAEKHGMDPTKVIEVWDANRVEASYVGTFLHNQIENYLKGKSTSLDCCFEYNGEVVRYKKKISIKKEFDYFLDFMRYAKVKPFRSEWKIFDERNGIAGTIDMICRNGSLFDIYDWKRSTKASPNENKWQFGINGLENVPDIRYYKYALQQNLYKYILEHNYGLKINKMYLVVLHPDNNEYIEYEVPQMEGEITIILQSL